MSGYSNRSFKIEPRPPSDKNIFRENLQQHSRSHILSNSRSFTRPNLDSSLKNDGLSFEAKVLDTYPYSNANNNSILQHLNDENNDRDFTKNNGKNDNTGIEIKPNDPNDPAFKTINNDMNHDTILIDKFNQLKEIQNPRWKSEPKISEEWKEINSKLMIELTSTTEKYIQLFVDYDRMQSFHKSIIKQNNEEIRDLKLSLDFLKIENEKLKYSLDQLTKNEKELKQNYDNIILRLREDLSIEREEKLSLISQFNELYFQFQDALNDTGKADANEKNERAKLLQQLASLQSELDYARTILIQNTIKADSEIYIRSQLGTANKRKTKYGRMYYIGHPKSFQEILIILEKLDSITLNSKDRLIALEELCIFCHGGEDNIEKLRQFKAGIHCTKSLASTNKAIVLRSLHLLSFLCFKSSQCTDQFIDNGGIKYLREIIDDPDEDFRIEALAIIKSITEFNRAILLIIKRNGVAQVLTSLEEGLQSQSDYGLTMSSLCLKSLCNIAKNQTGMKEIQCTGGIFTIIRCLHSENKHLKRLTAECLAICSENQDFQKSFCDLNGLKLLLELLNLGDSGLAKYAAKILMNLTYKNSIKEEIILEDGIPQLLKPFEWGDNWIIQLMFRSLINLCKWEDAAITLCQKGFLTKCTGFLKSQNDEIKRQAAECLSLITSTDISIEHIYGNVDIDRLISNLDPLQDLETSKFSFRILDAFMGSPFVYSKLLQYMDQIILYINQTLQSEISLNDKGECLKIMPKLIQNNEARLRLTKSNTIALIIRLLRQRFSFNENINNQLIIDILQILYLFMQEEYQDYQNQQHKVGPVHQDLMYSEQLLDLIAKLLQGYLELERIDFKLVNQIILCIEVLSHCEEYQKEFRQNDVVKYLMIALNKAFEYKENTTIHCIISCLAFYTNQEREWMTICKPLLVRICCSLLNGPSEFLRQRAKHCLYDLSFCPLLAHSITEISPNEGLRHLIDAYNIDKSIIEIIFQNCCQDEAFRALLTSTLPHQIILLGRGKDMHEFAFLKRDNEGQIPTIKKARLYTTKELMDQSYANLGNYYATILSRRRYKSMHNVIDENSALKTNSKVLTEISQRKIDPDNENSDKFNLNHGYFKNSDGNLIYQVKDIDMLYPNDSPSNFDPETTNTFLAETKQMAQSEISKEKTENKDNEINQVNPNNSDFSEIRNQINDIKSRFIARNSPFILKNTNINDTISNEISQTMLQNKFSTNLNDELQKLQKEEMVYNIKSQKRHSNDDENEEEQYGNEHARNNLSNKGINEYYGDDYLNAIKDTNRQNYFTQFLKESARKRAKEF